MSNRSPVFLFISSSGCGHCTTFRKSFWPDLEAHLKKEGNYRYYDLKDVTSQNLPKSIPQGIFEYTKRWYPFFMVVDGTEWNTGLEKKDHVLKKVSVMNSTGSGDDLKFKGAYPFTKDGVLAWLKTVNFSDNSRGEKSVIQPLVSKSDLNSNNLIIRSKIKDNESPSETVERVLIPSKQKLETCGNLKIVSRNASSRLS